MVNEIKVLQAGMLEVQGKASMEQVMDVLQAMSDTSEKERERFVGLQGSEQLPTK